METNEKEFDMEAAVAEIGDSMFPQDEAAESAVEVETEQHDAPIAEVEAVVTDAPVTPDRPAPKSWRQEHHETWAKMDTKAKEYYSQREDEMHKGMESYKESATYGKTLQDIINPYRPMLAATGMDDRTAVQTLMNAHYRLTQGDMQGRKQAFYELGQNLGFLNAPNTAPEDPRLSQMREQMNTMQAQQTQRDQHAYNETNTKMLKEVEVFAADPAHPLFNEVSDDIITMIKSGETSLQGAYEKAVWMNPVTRQKQLASMQTAQVAKLKDDAKQTAAKARQATSVNVRGRTSQVAPTEPMGSIQDTMAATLAEIRSRVT